MQYSPLETPLAVSPPPKQVLEKTPNKRLCGSEHKAFSSDRKICFLTKMLKSKMLKYAGTEGHIGVGLA